MFSLLLKELTFIFYLFLLRLVLCFVAALKSSPIHRQFCSLYFSFGPFRSAEIFLEIRKFHTFRPMCSKQVYVIWTSFGLISSFIDCLVKTRNYSILLWLSLPVHAGSLKGIQHSKLYSLAHALLNVFSAFKGTHFNILFLVTVACVLLCGRHKKQPRTSPPIVHFIFFFWSFEISGNIPRNQKIYMFRPMY